MILLKKETRSTLLKTISCFRKDFTKEQFFFRKLLGNTAGLADGESWLTFWVAG